MVLLPPGMLLTDQLTPAFEVPVTVAANACVPPSEIDADGGFTTTVTSGSMVIIEVATRVGSATLVAVTVTVEGEGTRAGAKKRPPGVTVPTLEFPPGIPLILKVTAVFARPVTVANNCAPRPTCTCIDVGVKEIVASGRIVMFEVADALVWNWLVAVTFTTAGVGTEVGATNRPVDEIVPTLALPPGTPLTLQLTPDWPGGVPLTVAVN